MRLTCIALAALIGVTVYPSVASAQDEAFKKGLQARGEKKWSEVERQMRDALLSDGVDSPRKVKSNLFASVLGAQGSEYLPHFFLGEALWNQQQCGPAVDQWLISEQQKAVLSSKPEYRQTMQKGYAECAARGVLLRGDFDTQMASSRQLYVDASAIAKRIGDLKESHKDQWQPFAPQFENARKEMTSAYDRLGVAQRTRLATDFTEVKLASERAINILRPLEEAFNGAIESVASLAQRIRDVTDAIAGAVELDKSIDTFKMTLTEPVNATRKSGRDQLAQGRDKLATGQKTQNLAMVNEAGKVVQGAAASFNQVLEQLNKARRSDLDQRLSIAMRSADEAFASISALMTTLEGRAAQTPDKVTPDISSQRDAIRKQIEAQRQRYERARKAEDVAGIDGVKNQLVEAHTALNTIIQAFGPLSLRDRGVSAGLEEGARMFLAGEYQKAIAALDPATGVDDAASPSLQLQAHLFRAASAFALYVRSGEGRQEWRTQALAEINRCKQIDATFEPSSQVFAPRFITLYKTGGAAAQTAAVTQ
jgi:tetratricopeptide (TPR) repeat protein